MTTLHSTHMWMPLSNTYMVRVNNTVPSRQANTPNPPSPSYTPCFGTHYLFSNPVGLFPSCRDIRKLTTRNHVGTYSSQKKKTDTQPREIHGSNYTYASYALSDLRSTRINPTFFFILHIKVHGVLCTQQTIALIIYPMYRNCDDCFLLFLCVFSFSFPPFAPRFSTQRSHEQKNKYSCLV